MTTIAAGHSQRPTRRRSVDMPRIITSGYAGSRYRVSSAPPTTENATTWASMTKANLSWIGMAMRGRSSPSSSLTAGNHMAAAVAAVRASMFMKPSRCHNRSPKARTIRAGFMAEVTLSIGDQSITSIITSRSAREMQLKPGQSAAALIKATEVMILRV